MKKGFFFIIPLIVVLLSLEAKATAILNQFAIRSEFLSENKLLALGGAAVTFTADVMFTKSGTINNTVIASLVYLESGQPDLVLASATRYDGDWITANTTIWQFTLTGTLPQNKTLGRVILRYQLFEGSTSAGIFPSGTEYEVTTVVIPPSNPAVRPIVPNTPYNKRFLVPAKTFTNANGTVTVASNGSYRVDFQTDANLVLYNGNTPLWASRKTAGGVSTLYVDANGNLRVWKSGTVWDGYIELSYLNNISIWVLQDDGNFVGYKSYTVDPQGNVIITGEPFGATMTQGGRKSNRSGRLN